MDSFPSCFVFRGRDLLVLAGDSASPAPPPANAAFLDDFPLRPSGIRILALPPDAPLPPGTAPLALRDAFAAARPWVASAARALSFLRHRKDHRFCGRCGAPMAPHPVEIASACTSCGFLAYPDPVPAVIVRIEKDGRFLLARHAYRTPHLWACIAGHVDPGESAEDCVRREVREETGLEIGDLRYVGSQHWPYPNQLMLAYTARWRAGEIRLQPEELLEAAWFPPDALPPTPPPGSIAWRLLHGAFPGA